MDDGMPIAEVTFDDGNGGINVCYTQDCANSTVELIMQNFAQNYTPGSQLNFVFPQLNWDAVSFGTAVLQTNSELLVPATVYLTNPSPQIVSQFGLKMGTATLTNDNSSTSTVTTGEQGQSYTLVVADYTSSNGVGTEGPEPGASSVGQVSWSAVQTAMGGFGQITPVNINLDNADAYVGSGVSPIPLNIPAFTSFVGVAGEITWTFGRTDLSPEGDIVIDIIGQKGA